MIERQLAVEAVRSESICFPHAQSVLRAERKVTHKKSGLEKSGVRHFIKLVNPVKEGTLGKLDLIPDRNPDQAVVLAKAAAMRAFKRLAAFLWITFLFAALSAVEA